MTADARGLPWLEFHAPTGRLLWADTLNEWHGLEPGAAPSWDLMHDRRHPADAVSVAGALSRCLTDGTPMAELHRIADDAGGWRWVILTAEARHDGSGQVTGLSGRLFDVTERQVRALAEWATAVVDATTESRSVIEQAKGALMLTYGLDAESAFGLLVWQSRHGNIKLRELATRLVAAAGGNPNSAGAVRARLDEIFFDAAFPGEPAGAAPTGSTRRLPRSETGFEVRRTKRDGACLLHVRGDIDLATAPRLDAALTRAFTKPPQSKDAGASLPVVVDLREVRHLGSFGVGLLVTHHRRAARAGVPMRIVTGAGPVRALLSLMAPDLPVAVDV